MRAVRWHGAGDVRVEEVAPPASPGAGEVRVRVAWCGLCGTDVHEYRFGPVHVSIRPHPVTGRSAPLTMGHEISGWVESVGDDVTGLVVGDLVALNALLPCGACSPCTRKDFHLCLTLGHLGQSADGGLADLLTVPAAMAVPALPGMSAEATALAEPFAVAMRAVRRAGRPTGRPCVVIGAGTIGLATATVLDADGNTVTVLDIAKERIRHAADLGFEAREVTDARTSGLQAPIVIECSGAAVAGDTAIRLAEPGGVVVIVGLPGGPSSLDLADVALREIRIVGSMSHLADTDMVPAMEILAAHSERAERIVTSRIALADTVTHGFDVLVGPERDRHAKILVKVNDAP
ncbi:alcohol dehydrogenase catalytic domain-containing protein [Planotetraspora mira]|uniref:2,3-butanediol dehydrogenase n=1 Tax=Planotetraspora mira TaxID=58121 RepID=A0A8J3TV16_9ACTN|nr:alcohol dehydrogenase catalytic domain-containing protein [Planotetraspora mira]GII32998.1 2,3-butanediol dehydrogenase [Planotetraspora mira]